MDRALGTGDRDGSLEQRFERSGIQVQGTLTNKSVEESRKRDSETHRIIVSKSFYLHYRFFSAQEVEYSAKDSVDAGSWD